jgi:hypothetical protein
MMYDTGREGIGKFGRNWYFKNISTTMTFISKLSAFLARRGRVRQLSIFESVYPDPLPYNTTQKMNGDMNKR